MTVLLDTHTFLWFIIGDRRLSSTARALIESDENQKLLSMASVWEMAIKSSLGKLQTVQPFEEIIPRQLRANRVGLLDIGLQHLMTLHALPFHHRDPFDRLIAAQCLTDGLALASRDPAFDAYGVERAW